MNELEALRENLKEAWSALAMIREAVETLAPSGAVKGVENLDGPTLMDEAEALVAGIRAMAEADARRRAALQKIAQDDYSEADYIDGPHPEMIWQAVARRALESPTK